MDSTEFSQTKSSLIPRLKEELEDLSNRNLRRRILTPESGQKEKIVLEGDTLLNFTSNNYLGLATDPALIRASIEATETYGTSVAASRLLVGSTPLHDQLEESIAGRDEPLTRPRARKGEPDYDGFRPLKIIGAKTGGVPKDIRWKRIADSKENLEKAIALQD